MEDQNGQAASALESVSQQVVADLFDLAGEWIKQGLGSGVHEMEADGSYEEAVLALVLYGLIRLSSDRAKDFEGALADARRMHHRYQLHLMGQRQVQ